MTRTQPAKQTTPTKTKTRSTTATAATTPATPTTTTTTTVTTPAAATAAGLQTLEISQKTPEDGAAESPTKKRKTNHKKQKATNGKFFIFEMKDGTYTEINGVRMAACFEKDYGDIINTKKNWTTKKQRDKYMATRKISPTMAPNGSAQIQSRADQIIQGVTRDNVENSNRIEGFYKSTSNSIKAILLFRLRTPYKDDFWCWKPEWMLDILIRFKDDPEVTDPLLKKYLASLSHAYASDPDNYDKTVKRLVEYEDKTKKHRSYEALVPYGFIDIPVDTLESRMREDEWISATSQKILEGLLTIFRGEVFAECVKRMPNRDRFAEIIFNEKSKSNWVKYMAGAIIRCKHIDHLTDLVIQQEANRITDVFYSNRLTHQKYAPEEDDDCAEEEDPSSEEEEE